MDILQVKNLNFSYDSYDPVTGEKAAESVEILHDISFVIKEGSFVVLCGATGCGKSTLLRLLKKELQPAGKLTGQILFDDKVFSEWSDRESASAIGFVMQNPNDQCVTDKVWHELAFGLENMGVASGETRRRVAEVAAYFGIDEWYERSVDTLSGGQKQLLNLAAVMVMNPRVLILDEPTAQLDPIAAQNFLNVLQKVNRELGITVILAEHRLEEAFMLADSVLVMEKGRIAIAGEPKKTAGQVSADMAIYGALPEAVRLYHQLEYAGEIPVSISEGRTMLRSYLEEKQTAQAQQKMGDKTEMCLCTDTETVSENAKAALELKNIYFRYEKRGADILKDVCLKVYEGEIVCLLGSNASGKSTLLKVIAGICNPQSGKLRIHGQKRAGGNVHRIGYLPQDIETLFVADTVEKELALVGEQSGNDFCSDAHPYDLSGGEKQLLGIKKVLAGGKQILLLDEPTKGLDAQAKEVLRRRLLAEKEKGVAIILVTHDPEFAADCADRCGLFFRGEVVALQESRSFFDKNHFYTTAAARIAKGYAEGVVTSEELYAFCQDIGVSDCVYRNADYRRERI